MIDECRQSKNEIQRTWVGKTLKIQKKLKRIQVEELCNKKEIRDIKQTDKNFKIDLTLIKQ